MALFTVVQLIFYWSLDNVIFQVFEVEVSDGGGKKRRLDNILDLADMKMESTEEEKIARDPHRAVPHNMLDWNVSGCLAEEA